MLVHSELRGTWYHAEEYEDYRWHSGGGWHENSRVGSDAPFTADDSGEFRTRGPRTEGAGEGEAEVRG